MTPEDDAYWPACGTHKAPDGFAPRHWCDWTANHFRHNQDAPTIQPGMRYCIPIVPAKGAYAEVSISHEMVNDQFAELFLIKPEGGVFTTVEREVPLGYWTRGEGRISIAFVVSDWADGSVPEKCAAATHAFGEERDVQTILRHGDDLTKKLYWWNLAYHGMCTACWERRVSTNQATTATAQSSGIDPNDFARGGIQPPPGGLGATVNIATTHGSGNINTVQTQSAAERTRDALRNRFNTNGT